MTQTEIMQYMPPLTYLSKKCSPSCLVGEQLNDTFQSRVHYMINIINYQHEALQGGLGPSKMLVGWATMQLANPIIREYVHYL